MVKNNFLITFISFLTLICLSGISFSQARAQKKTAYTIATIRYLDGRTINGANWLFDYSCRSVVEGNPNMYSVRDKQSRDLHISISTGGNKRSIPEHLLNKITFHWAPKEKPYYLEKVLVSLTNGENIELEFLNPGMALGKDIVCDAITFVFPPEGPRKEYYRQPISGKLSFLLAKTNFGSEAISEIVFRHDVNKIR